MSEIVYQPSQTTHWRNLFESKSMLLGSHNLNPGEELVAEIAGVGVQKIKNQNGKDEHVPVATFTNAPPMVLNITNCRTIESLYGPYQADWIGKRIQIFATKVKAFGQEQMALRIRLKEPANNVDVSQFENSLRACKSMKELQGVFMAIPKHLKGSLTAVKDEMKGKLNA